MVEQTNNELYNKENKDVSNGGIHETDFSYNENNEDNEKSVQENTGIELNEFASYIETHTQLDQLKSTVLETNRFGLNKESSYQEYIQAFADIKKELRQLKSKNKGEKGHIDHIVARIKDAEKKINRLDKGKEKNGELGHITETQLQEDLWKVFEDAYLQLDILATNQDPYESLDLYKGELNGMKKIIAYKQQLALIRTKYEMGDARSQELDNYIKWLDNDGWKLGAYVPINAIAYQRLVASHEFIKNFHKDPYIENASKKDKKTKETTQVLLTPEQQRRRIQQFEGCKTQSGDYTKRFDTGEDAFKSSPADGWNYMMDSAKKEGYINNTVAGIGKTLPSIVYYGGMIAMGYKAFTNVFGALGSLFSGNFEEGFKKLGTGALWGAGLYGLVNGKDIWRKVANSIGENFEGSDNVMGDGTNGTVDVYNSEAPDEIKDRVYYPYRCATCIGSIPFKDLQTMLSFDESGKVTNIDKDTLDTYIKNSSFDASKKAVLLANINKERQMGDNAILKSLGILDLTKDLITKVENGTKTVIDFFHTLNPLQGKEYKAQRLEIKKIQRSTQLLLRTDLHSTTKTSLTTTAEKLFKDGYEDFKFGTESGQLSVISETSGIEVKIDMGSKKLQVQDRSGVWKELPMSFATTDGLLWMAYRMSSLVGQYGAKAQREAKPFVAQSMLRGGDVRFIDPTKRYHTGWIGEEAIDAGSVWSDAKTYAPDINNEARMTDIATFLNDLQLRHPDGATIEGDKILDEELMKIKELITPVAEKFHIAYLQVKDISLDKLPGYLAIFESQMSKFPDSLLQKANLQTVILDSNVDDIMTPDRVEVGLYNTNNSTLTLDVSKRFKETIAHEVFHAMDHTFNGLYNQNWNFSGYSPTGFASGPDIGFARNYGKFSASEDRSTIVEALFSDKNALLQKAKREISSNPPNDILKNKIETITGCSLVFSGNEITFSDTVNMNRVNNKYFKKRDASIDANYRNALDTGSSIS